MIWNQVLSMRQSDDDFNILRLSMEAGHDIERPVGAGISKHESGDGTLMKTNRD